MITCGVQMARTQARNVSMMQKACSTGSCPGGGNGSRAWLKPRSLRGCGFESRSGHTSKRNAEEEKMGRGDSGAKRAIKKRKVYLVKTKAAMDPELVELLKNPEFIESLEQMRRGEGRVITEDEWENLQAEATRREFESD